MLSPFEQNTTIGERILRRSMTVPSEALDFACRKIVADEKFIDNELYFFGVQIDVPSPPVFETKIPRGFGVDVGV